MEKLIDKISLRKAFSEAACDYDSQAFLQRKLSLDFLNKIISNCLSPKNILDVGMGTGFLMQKLSQHFNAAKVSGVDFAFGMNRVAYKKDLTVLQADAEFLPFKNELFDLAVSSFVYQWVDNLDYAFFEVSRILKKGGIFYFNFFGKETLKELRFSFAENNRINSLFDNNFNPIDEAGLRKVLERNNFKEITISPKTFTENFENLFSLAKWLKSIGANRLNRPIFMGKDTWQEANEIYLRNFNDRGLVYATFEVIEVKARK